MGVGEGNYIITRLRNFQLTPFSLTRFLPYSFLSDFFLQVECKKVNSNGLGLLNSFDEKGVISLIRLALV